MVKKHVIALLFLVSTGFSSSAAVANGVEYVQCDAEMCYRIACMPSVGCTVIGMWPRPREVGDD